MAKKVLSQEEAQVRRDKCRILSVYIRKGGVGKTVSALNIAGWLAKGYKDPKTKEVIIPRSKVLIIDYDNQINLTKTALANCTQYNQAPVTLYDLLIKGDIELGHNIEEEFLLREDLTPHEERQLRLIQSRKNLFNFDAISVNNAIFDAYRGRRIKNTSETEDDVQFVRYNVDILPGLHNADYNIFKSDIDNIISTIMFTPRKSFDYDYIILDCPPENGKWMETALRVSDFVVVPTEDTLAGIDGVNLCYDELLEMRETKNEKYKSYCEFLGTFLCNINEKDSKMLDYIRASLRGSYGRYFIEQSIRSDVSNMKLSQIEGVPMCYYKSQSRLSVDYRNLVIELIRRMDLIEGGQF